MLFLELLFICPK